MSGRACVKITSHSTQVGCCEETISNWLHDNGNLYMPAMSACALVKKRHLIQHPRKVCTEGLLNMKFSDDLSYMYVQVQQDSRLAEWTGARSIAAHCRFESSASARGPRSALNASSLKFASHVNTKPRLPRTMTCATSRSGEASRSG